MDRELKLCQNELHDMTVKANILPSGKCRTCATARYKRYRDRRRDAGLPLPLERPGLGLKVSEFMAEAMDLWLQYPVPRTTAEPRKDWIDDADCQYTDPDIFFLPDEWDQLIHSTNQKAAKAICSTCPVRKQCLSYAIRHGETHGVWGGTTASERKRARKMAGLGEIPEPAYYEPVREPIEEVPLEEWDTWTLLAS